MHLDKNLNNKEIQLERIPLLKTSEMNEAQPKKELHSPSLSNGSNIGPDFSKSTDDERFQKCQFDDLTTQFTDRKSNN